MLRAHPDLDRDGLVRLSRALWRRRLHELRGVAILLLQDRWELLEILNRKPTNAVFAQCTVLVSPPEQRFVSGGRPVRLES